MEYFATHSKGMNYFFSNELLNNNASIIKIHNGRTIFSFAGNAELLTQLKSCERLFYCICYKEIKLHEIESYLLNLREILINKMRLIFNEDYFKKRTVKTYRINIKTRLLNDVERYKFILILNNFIKLSDNSLNVELRKPQFELCVHYNNDGLFIGIPLSLKPNSYRLYDNGIRTPIAYALIYLAEKYSEIGISLDPFCGKGTILMEYMIHNSLIIGGDINKKQQNLNQNLITLKYLDLIIFDINHIPFRNNTINCIISDIPHGRRYLKLIDIYSSLDNWFFNLYQILIKNGVAIILVSLSIIDILLYYTTNINNFQPDNHDHNDYKWQLIYTHEVSFGKNCARILVLRKI